MPPLPLAINRVSLSDWYVSSYVETLEKILVSNMQYGFILPGGDIHTLIELAVEAEAAGWDGFFIWDHMFFDPSFHPILDPWVGLAAVATAPPDAVVLDFVGYPGDAVRAAAAAIAPTPLVDLSAEMVAAVLATMRR